MLTTTAADGTLTSRPMALQEVEFDGDLWFIGEGGSEQLLNIHRNPNVNVSVASGSSWVSVAGHASEVEDDEKKRELWNAGVEAWFPDGVESPEAVVIKVEGDSAEYWDSPGGRVASVISFAKAKATGERYEGGDNEKIEL